MNSRLPRVVKRGDGVASEGVVVAAKRASDSIKRVEKTWDRIFKEMETINFGRIKSLRKKKASLEIVPKNLTDAMILILCNWEENAKLLVERGIASREEIFQEDVCIFQNSWLKESLRINFPQLMEGLYGKTDVENQFDEKRFRSSVSAILAQSIKAFTAVGFMKKQRKRLKSRTKRYQLSVEFSFLELKEIYRLKAQIEKINNKTQSLIKGRGVVILTVNTGKKVS